MYILINTVYMYIFLIYDFLQVYINKVKEFSVHLKTLISVICVKFNQLYTELESLLSSDSSAKINNKNHFLLEFVVQSLLPGMTNQVNKSTKQLIENIEFSSQSTSL